VAAIDTKSLFNRFLKLILLAVSVIYTTLVVLADQADDVRLKEPFNRHDLMRSSERLVIRLGLLMLRLVLRFASRIFEMLSEASAEVGEWFLSHYHIEMH
jgi:hypothetical protein